jgi:N-acetylmuramoyl-L-alanine amidase CwlA
LENENHFRQKAKPNKPTVPKKRVKNHVPKEANLNENEVLVGSYVMELNDKYICNIKNHKYCLIKDDRHLSLNNFAISLWAKEIVCNF